MYTTSILENYTGVCQDNISGSQVRSSSKSSKIRRCPYIIPRSCLERFDYSGKSCVCNETSLKRNDTFHLCIPYSYGQVAEQSQRDVIQKQYRRANPYFCTVVAMLDGLRS
jgi:hypothetical protein